MLAENICNINSDRMLKNQTISHLGLRWQVLLTQTNPPKLRGFKRNNFRTSGFSTIRKLEIYVISSQEPRNLYMIGTDYHSCNFYAFSFAHLFSFGQVFCFFKCYVEQISLVVSHWIFSEKYSVWTSGETFSVIHKIVFLFPRFPQEYIREVSR
jgi:hypothetical protein